MFWKHPCVLIFEFLDYWPYFSEWWAWIFRYLLCFHSAHPFFSQKHLARDVLKLKKHWKNNTHTQTLRLKLKATKTNRHFKKQPMSWTNDFLRGGFKYFLFSPWEVIHFDVCIFSKRGLVQPPTNFNSDLFDFLFGWPPAPGIRCCPIGGNKLQKNALKKTLWKGRRYARRTLERASFNKIWEPGKHSVPFF